MNEVKIRFIPVVGLFFCFNIFFSWMSHNFYPDNSFGYGLFGALCTSFCLYFSIKGIQDNEDFTNSIPEKLKFGTAPIFTLAIITFICFIIITTNLTILYSNIKENELKQFGKITTGEVTEGYSLTDRNNIGSYNVTVEYKLNGETITAFTKVSPTEFQNCYVGKEINLIYSTKNQNLIDIIGDDDKVKTYINIKNREILVKDLISIINLDEKQTLNYLNSVNYPWKYDSYKKTWINSEKNLLVVKNEKNSVSYLVANYNPMNINEELKQLKFNKIDTVNSKKLSAGEKIKQSMLINEGIYTNENYDVIIKAPYVNGTIALVINVHKKQ
jgi:hypothetical protein